MMDLESDAAQEGWAKIQEEDYSMALALFLPLAEQGNAFALYNIGWMCIFLGDTYFSPMDRSLLLKDAEPGLQFPNRATELPDSMRAQIKWYTKAAAQGHPEAIFLLFHLYKDHDLGEVPWHSLTGKLKEMYAQGEQGGYFQRGMALMDEIRAEMSHLGLDPTTVFNRRE